MPEPTDAAKSSGTGSAAISSPRGTDDSTVSLSTSSPAPTEEAILSKTASGDVAEKMAATPGETTQACSLESNAASVLKRIRHVLRTDGGYDTCSDRIDVIVEEYERELPPPRLSVDEAQKLYRIRKDRANRFMASVTDVDFLLEIVERLSQ